MRREKGWRVKREETGLEGWCERGIGSGKRFEGEISWQKEISRDDDRME